MMENENFYFNYYFFITTPTNRNLRQKAVYFPAQPVEVLNRAFSGGA